MHLRRFVRGAINAVNHDKLIVWLQSQGPINDRRTGFSTPTYATARGIWAQIQPVPTDELSQFEQLNIQGVLRQVYMRGAVASAVRADGTGGDLLQFPERWTSYAEEVMAAWTADSIVSADSDITSDAGVQTWAPPPIRTWLVMLVQEQWNDWCKVVVRMQNDQNSEWASDSAVPADSTGDTASG